MSTNSDYPKSKFHLAEKPISCPYCKSTSVDRIPRSKMIKTFFFWADLKHYVCYSCIRKFYKRNKY